MSEEDRERWNAKHRAARGASLEAPDPLVLEALGAAELGPSPRILDFACGRGRHALEWARRGWEAHAWDVSEDALTELADRAQTMGLEVQTRRVDLDALALDSEPFDLICVVNFLDRKLPEKVKPLLAAGGMLLLCTFTDDFSGPHPSPRHRLRAGELESGWPEYSTKFFAERNGRAVLLAEFAGGVPFTT